MQTFITAYVSALVAMLALDYVWLTAMAGFYREKLSHLFAPTFSLPPAALFYLIYALALVVLVVLPAVRLGYSLPQVFLASALMGLAAYAAYDLTNAATLKEWPMVITVYDMLWGTLLTGVSGLISFSVIKHFF